MLNLVVRIDVETKLIIFINDIMLEYIFPVTFLFYFAFSIDHDLSRSKRRYWLFLPFLLAATINIIIDLEIEFGLIDVGAKVAEKLIGRYYFWEYVGTLLFTIVLSIWSFLIIRQYRPRPEVYFKKQWFTQFWFFANGLILIWIIDMATDIIAGIDLLSYLYGGICLLFFWATYRGIYQFKLAEEQYEIRTILNRRVMKNAPSPIATSNQDELPKNLHIQRFHKLMQEAHAYRDPELNRDTIAATLGISSGYFSQIFSQYFDQNFSEYINELRVEEVKRMLTDSAFQQYSLIAIGFEAGFSSKSNFYSVFKRIAGMTPSAYKQQRFST